MKKISTIIMLAVIVLFGATACAQKEGTNTTNSLKDKKVLVAYFSWSGNTAEIADLVAEWLKQHNL